LWKIHRAKKKGGAQTEAAIGTDVCVFMFDKKQAKNKLNSAP